MSYIPAADAAFAAFATNFADLVTADPAAYGETAGSALVVQDAVDDFNAAYTLATNPATRTTPVIADKDDAKAIAIARIRPMAMRINALSTVTNEQRESLGITVRKTTKTPVPAPVTAPVLSIVDVKVGLNTLSIRDSETPTSKAKPYGVTKAQIFRAVGDVAAVDPASASFFAETTKTPAFLSTEGVESGKIVTYFARWGTRSGPTGQSQMGPFSLPLSVVAL